MQLTFQRGNYTGHWVEGSPGSGSGSLEILFKGVQEIVLHDKTETAAEIGFINYATPDTRQIAQDLVDDLTDKNGLPQHYPELVARGISDPPQRLSKGGFDFALSLLRDKYVQDDVDAVRRHVITLLQGQGFDTSEFDDE